MSPLTKLDRGEEEPAERVVSDRVSGSLKKQEVKTYVVQAGDTLSKISQAVYGDPARWKEIYEANKSVIPNPNVIQVGLELKIP